MARNEITPIGAGMYCATPGLTAGRDGWMTGALRLTGAIRPQCNSIPRIDGTVTGPQRMMRRGWSCVAKIKPNETEQAGFQTCAYAVRSLIAVTKQMVG
jgi:hypothetical protein